MSGTVVIACAVHSEGKPVDVERLRRPVPVPAGIAPL